MSSATATGSLFDADRSVFDRLNESQRAAVEHGDGPLIVLAGPGTGKTRVLTCRVAHLVVRRGVAPEQIVAVTYTVKAARELRERLAGVIGASAADRVHAHTFHGLGLRLLKRFGDVLGLPPVSLRERGAGGGGGILDTAQSRRLLREIVLEHGLFPHAAGLGVDAVILDVQRRMAQAANHGLSPAGCATFCERWGALLDAGRGCDGRELDETGAASDRERHRDFADFARAYDLFDRACRRLGFFSFDDLIGLPIRVLRESPRAAAIMRDEWRHLVVDEFQDVNAAQIELLRELAPPGSGGPVGPSLCVVGDDDQSIYGFRGADDLAFRKFARVWNNAATVELRENYRSEPAIVHVANAVIGRAPVRFAPDKVVEVARERLKEGPCAGGSVECVQLEHDFQDGDLIAAMILADRARRPERPLSGYAVLARNHSDLDRVHAALRIEGIPAAASRAGSAAEDEGVKDVLAWVQLLVRPREAWHARRLLIRPPLSCPLDAVHARESRYRADLSRLQAGEPGAQDPGPYAEWLAAHFPDDPAVQRLWGWYEELRRVAAACPADEAVFRIVALTGAAHADLLGARERAVRVSNLVTLVRFARERQGRLDEPGTLADFWKYYQDLDATEQGLGAHLDERVDGGGEEEGVAPADAVRLITAHGAKGLEFDTVFVTRVTPQHGFGTTRSEEEAPLPAGLVDRDGDDRTPKERAIAEERRLFYVACTRAKRRLVLLAKKNKNRSRSTHFFEEIVHDPACKDRVVVREAADVLREAAELGATAEGAALRDELEARGLEFQQTERRREVFARFRREARVAAATSLDAADRPGSSPEQLRRATRRLLDAAARLAVIAHVEKTGAAPAWVAEEGNGLAEYAQTLVRAVDPSRGSGSPAERCPLPGVAALRAPLRLSYTSVSDYLSCPRCFYVRHVLGWEEPEGAAQIVGIAVHDALERFYRAFREADANGAEPPDLEALLRLGSEAFFARWPRHEPVDRGQLEQVRGQLRLVFERLHDPESHVLELERRVEFPYVCSGAPDGSPAHVFTAKVDRVDQIRLPDGRVGFRIVDYKTGKPSRGRSQPKRDDLQLGVYTLAAAHLLCPRTEAGEIDLDSLCGTAEYWLLATGERGVIDLCDLDLAGMRQTIDGAVAGMLAGAFERSSSCRGGCEVLGPA